MAWRRSLGTSVLTHVTATTATTLSLRSMGKRQKKKACRRASTSARVESSGRFGSQEAKKEPATLPTKNSSSHKHDDGKKCSIVWCGKNPTSYWTVPTMPKTGDPEKGGKLSESLYKRRKKAWKKARLKRTKVMKLIDRNMTAQEFEDSLFFRYVVRWMLTPLTCTHPVKCAMLSAEAVSFAVWS